MKIFIVIKNPEENRVGREKKEEKEREKKEEKDGNINIYGYS